MVKRIVSIDGDQFAPKFAFVFVQGGSNKAARKVQTHIQREVAKKKRWSTKQRRLEMSQAASVSFKQTFITTNEPPPTVHELGHESPPNYVSQSVPEELLVLPADHSPVHYDISPHGDHNESLDFPLPTAYYEQQIVPFSPRTLMGAGRTNPFHTHAIDFPNVDRFIDEFLYLDVKDFGLDSFRTKFGPVRSVVLPMALGDPASLSAISTYSALDSFPPRHDEAISLKLQTIRMVNSRLTNVTEHLLYTVTLLWMVESHHGSKIAAQWHARGLSQMIAQLGGFQCLGLACRMMIARNIFTCPATLVLDPLPQEFFLRGCLAELITFAENVHTLANIKRSPYVPSSPFMQELSRFPLRTHLFHLLSGTAASPTRWKDLHEIQARYRLACLLHIHAIFLHNRHNPQELREEWRRIFQNLIRHGIEKVGNVENLRSFMLIPPSSDGKTRFDPERELKVLRIVCAAKEMSLESLDGLGELFFGYLRGKRYEGDNGRKGMWDVERMEYETFGGKASSCS